MHGRDALRSRRPTVRSGARRASRFGIGLSSIAAAVLALAETPSPPDMPLERDAAESLRFTIAAPPLVGAAEPVHITLRLTNAADHPVAAYLVGRVIAFDIVIAREDGAVVWHRLEGATVASILQVRTLKPHETMEFSDVWPQRGSDGKPVAPGTYDVWGLLPSDAPEPRRTATVKLRIVRKK
ncbi:MAG TPA: BsuPI-related putative proteinase inhibitor [Gemmatimonadales bacterium]|nr:BsuPI-related putative proteinase inhibitor [Gemmatimonadales bacterium]